MTKQDKQKDTGNMEMILDFKQCCEVALMVYGKYQEWLKEPMYMMLSFDEWCKQAIKGEEAVYE